MTSYSFKLYQRELTKIERQLEALRPAAQALGVSFSLERVVSQLLAAQSTARVQESME
jgi:hypothetical protein